MWLTSRTQWTVHVTNTLIIQHSIVIQNQLISITVSKTSTKTLSHLGEYSQRSSLALNAPKRNGCWYLLGKLSRFYHLHNFKEQVSCNNTQLERVAKTKLLGLLMDEHLSLDEHVSSSLSSCYGVLSILRKLKEMAPYYVRKLLMECLVLSKLDYAAAVFYPLPLYQLTLEALRGGGPNWPPLDFLGFKVLLLNRLTKALAQLFLVCEHISWH